MNYIHYIINNSVTVLNATGELFDPAWTRGNLSTISPLVKVLGFFAVIILSVAGFITIISATSKPAFALIYLSNRKLWDRVDEAKRVDYEEFRRSQGYDLDKAGAMGASGVHKLLGTITFNILRILPGIKAITDFDTEDGVQKDPKQYLLQTVLVCLAFSFLGTFIFYGYHAQFGNKVGETSKVVMDYALANIDLVEIFNKTSKSFVKLNSAFKDAKDIADKAVYKAADAMYTSVATAFDDMEKSSRQSVFTQLEKYMAGKQKDWEGVSGKEGWNISVNANMSGSSLEGTGTWKDIGDGWANNSNDDNYKMYYYQVPVSALETGSAKQADRNSEFVQCKITFTKKSVKASLGGGSEAELTIKIAGTSSGVKIDVGPLTDFNKLTMSGNIILKDSAGNDIATLSGIRKDTTQGSSTFTADVHYEKKSNNKKYSFADIKNSTVDVGGWTIRTSDGVAIAINKVNVVKTGSGGTLVITSPGSNSAITSTVADVTTKSSKEIFSKPEDKKP